MTTSRIPPERYLYTDVTTSRMPPERYLDEYAPITARITPMLAAVERSPLTQLAAGLLLAIGCFLAGWYARGLWGPVWDQRGWAALVVFSIVGSVWMVNERNRER